MASGRVIKPIVTIRAALFQRRTLRPTDKIMPNLTPHAPLSEADYEAIESAVMETSRGRWFLAEFARRNRTADTTMLLKALGRIEQAVTGERLVSAVDRIRFDLVEMANAIARTKAEIAALKPEGGTDRFEQASEELDCVVQTTEAATSDILNCAERIQELAWTMREQGLAPELCDLIDARATEIYTACSFQDLTGQRIRKVIGVLRYLEGRINTMIEIWGLDGAQDAADKPLRLAEVTVLHGPARPGEGLDQADIDMVMESPNAAAYPAFLDGDDLVPDEMPAPDLKMVSPLRAEPSAPAPRSEAPAPPAPTPVDPLAPIVALSAEEKIALFS
jgi:chemotaxis regulatin CheY-phosphate phosphatase CheZ